MKEWVPSSASVGEAVMPTKVHVYDEPDPQCRPKFVTFDAKGTPTFTALTQSQAESMQRPKLSKASHTDYVFKWWWKPPRLRHGPGNWTALLNACDTVFESMNPDD